jgi:hypothetical protein
MLHGDEQRLAVRGEAGPANLGADGAAEKELRRPAPLDYRADLCTPFPEHLTTPSTNLHRSKAHGSPTLRTIACDVTRKSIFMTATSPSCRRRCPRQLSQCDGETGTTGLDTAIPENVRLLAEKAVVQTSQSMTVVQTSR